MENTFGEMICKSIIVAIIFAIMIFTFKVYMVRSNPCFEDAIDRNLTLKQYYYTVDTDAYKLKYNDWDTYSNIQSCYK